MKLTQFIKPINLHAVLANLCMMLRLLGMLLGIPLLIALIAAEWNFALIFLGMSTGAYALGSLGKIFNQAEMALKEAMVVTALSYLMFGLMGSIAFLPQVGFIDGFFEAMSGFTTTGLTVLQVESLPKSLLFFRAYAQWIGGAGIVVLSVVMLVGPGKDAFQLYSSEYGEENLAGDVKATGLLVFKVYASLTIVGFLAFLAAGMDFFDALLHVLSTVSTGGFSSQASSIGQYDNPVLSIVVALFMMFGAIGFPTYYLLWHTGGLKRCWRDIQLRGLVIFIVLATVIFLSAWNWNVNKLMPSFFQAVSAVTTSGFQVESYRVWPQEVKLGSILLMIIGGSTGSTAGGIKIFRLLLTLYLLRWMVLRIMLPEEAKLPIKYGDFVLSDENIKQIFSFLACYAAVLAFSTYLLVSADFGIADALFESASALGTVGLSSGITSIQLLVWTKLLLIFDMWAGRLEIFPVLLVYYPRIWKSSRRKT